MNTLYEALRASSEEFPDKACIAVPAREGRGYAESGLEMTYREVHLAVAAIADVYADAGYGLGHRVALLLDSRPDMVLHVFALNRIGASAVPVNPDYRDDEMRYVLEHSEVQLVVALNNHAQRARKAIEGIASPPALTLFDEFSNGIVTAPTPRLNGQPGTATEAAILYTSGTTAAPKGCVATNAYGLYAGERYLKAGGVIDIRRGAERLFNPLPLFYVNSLLITTMTMILSGGCSIYPDRFHPKTWWSDVIETRATMIQYLGIVLPALNALPVSPAERSHSVRIAVGAGVDPTMHQAYQDRFGIPVVEVWGMTEVAIASIACHEPRGVGTRSIGQPCVGMEFSIVDDTDRQLGVGEIGELVVRRSGPDPRWGLVGEYLKDAAATQAAWKGGWFHTGDLAELCEDGSYRFVDRKKDIIRRSGQNIAASEIEAILVQHPDVARAACIAAPDEMREEEVYACIILKQDTDRNARSARAIMEFALDRLAYFKAPGWIAFFDSLPLTATQKLQKRSIFAAGTDPRNHPGVHDLRSLKRPDRNSA